MQVLKSKSKLLTEAIFYQIWRIRNKNLDKLVGGDLNINSPIPKYDELKPFLIAKVDIIIISEIKLEETFFFYVFPIEGFYNILNWMKTVIVVV